MSGRRPLRVLLVSPLDYDRGFNNREHHLVRFLAAAGDEVTHVYKVLKRSERLGDLVRDSLACAARARTEAGVRLIAVDPFFNYAAGFRTRALAEGEAERRRRPLLRRLLLPFHPLAVLRDLFFVPCAVAAVLFRTRGRHDVCLGLGPWGTFAGWLLRALGRVRLLVYEDRDFEPGLVRDRVRSAYTAWLERFSARRARLVVSLGERLAALRRRQGAADVMVVPTGVDWERFAPARAVESRSPRLFYSGNVIGWSGLEMALKALPAIRGAVPGATLEVVGDGPPAYRAALEALAGALGVGDAVRFLGPRPHDTLPGLMAGAAAGLANAEPVPYRTYACPLKLIEYMAAGLPAIGTSDSETTDLLARWDCGLAADYAPDAFAVAAIRLLTDRALHARLRANAIRVSEGLRWESLLAREREAIERRLEA